MVRMGCKITGGLGATQDGEAGQAKETQEPSNTFKHTPQNVGAKISPCSYWVRNILQEILESHVFIMGGKKRKERNKTPK